MMTPLAENSIPRQSYSLSTLLLGMTVCAVWLTLIIKLPSVGFSCLIFLLPAVARTIASVNVRKRQGLSTSLHEKLFLLMESAFACFGAFIVFVFVAIVSFFILLVVFLIFSLIIPSGETWHTVVFVLFFSCMVIATLLALIPAFYLLTVDWPQAYDLRRRRFLTRVEVSKLEETLSVYPIKLPTKKPPCSECHVPGRPTESPCKLCGRVGPISS